MRQAKPSISLSPTSPTSPIYLIQAWRLKKGEISGTSNRRPLKHRRLAIIYQACGRQRGNSGESAREQARDYGLQWGGWGFSLFVSNHSRIFWFLLVRFFFVFCSGGWLYLLRCFSIIPKQWNMYFLTGKILTFYRRFFRNHVPQYVNHVDSFRYVPYHFVHYFCCLSRVTKNNHYFQIPT